MIESVGTTDRTIRVRNNLRTIRVGCATVRKTGDYLADYRAAIAAIGNHTGTTPRELLSYPAGNDNEFTIFVAND